MVRPKKIGHVVLKVRDLAQALAFYTEIVGFEVVSRCTRPRGVFLTLGVQHHDLALFEVSPAAADPQENQTGLHHLALQVESFEALKAAHAELTQHGVRILRAVDHGTTKSVYFCDPDGNRLELYCDVGSDGLERARSRGERALDEFPPLSFAE